jgi:hypothetical protein
MPTRSELVAEMKLKTKMANNILTDLMKDNTLAYSSYYNQHILNEAKNYSFIGTKRKEQIGRTEDSDYSNYYTLKTGSIGYTKNQLEHRIRIANKIITESKQGGMLSREFIEANTDRLMDKFGFVNKDTLLKVYEIYRRSNFAEYIKYELDQTDYESTLSKVGNLLEAGVGEDTINEIWNNIEERSTYQEDAVRDFRRELTSTLIKTLSKE